MLTTQKFLLNPAFLPVSWQREQVLRKEGHQHPWPSWRRWPQAAPSPEALLCSLARLGCPVWTSFLYDWLTQRGGSAGQPWVEADWNQTWHVLSREQAWFPWDPPQEGLWRQQLGYRESGRACVAHTQMRLKTTGIGCHLNQGSPWKSLGVVS